MIRLLVIDDHHLVRKGLVSLLNSEPGFLVVGEASSIEEALSLVALVQADVALVDLRMPSVSGCEGIPRLLARLPSLGVVVVTASEDSGDLLNAIRAGARGYVLKNANIETLLDVIRRVNAGSAGLDTQMAPAVIDLLRSPAREPIPGPSLTPREQEVAALLVEGADNAQIAQRLVISENTVKSHISHIFEKTGARSRTDLLAVAGRSGRGINTRAS